jgi:protein-L-isoaspartate(D-aspartate) O-methyltransferase
MDSLESAREAMVEQHLGGRDIIDPLVLEAMRTTPREAFVPEALRGHAYDDRPLPIGEDQTISQPYIVAAMIQAADIRPGDKVLEIGAGSGYAAAVMAEIADTVFTIERKPALARAAQATLERLGYANVHVITGDGTLGLPGEAPFDAIICAAGGPGVPESWRDQLAVGGRLVMPVGELTRFQSLIKVTRESPDRYVEQDLGAVAFVPLIGSEGWLEDESGPSNPNARREPSSFRPTEERPLAEVIYEAAEELPGIDASAFAEAFDRFAERKVVLLGESTHGTSEFYRARAAITRRLIEEHGFSFVAVEADWPDAAMIDRYVRHRDARPGSEPPFRRFPTWMWRNTEVEAFTEWLRGHNDPLPASARAAFYGLDLYSLSTSINFVIDYLEQIDPEAANAARERYGCLTPWQKDPAVYGRAVMSRRYRDCEDEVVGQLISLLDKRLVYMARDGTHFLDAAQNARVVAAAEGYYRAIYSGEEDSWNLRDTHMFGTLRQTLDAHGPDAKAVVWAHNSHIGDARYTEMGIVRRELNLGQLCREAFGDEAALIGFGTNSGTVAAANDWGGSMEVKTIRPGLPGSYEAACHASGAPCFLLDLSERKSPTARHRLLSPRLERFIGVIYRPESERLSHYAKASLPQQFDAFVWFDDTRAVTPLPTGRREGAPETWPFGL